MTQPRDSRRAAVYAAEDQLAALLARGGAVDFHGSTVDIPRQRRFATLPDVQRYLDHVRECSWGYPQTPAPIVRPRRGTAKAHWQAPATIALPDSTTWAMTELVVLHEYSHHVVWHLHGTVGHDRRYCQVMRGLVSDAIGPEAGLILLAAYDHAGATNSS